MFSSIKEFFQFLIARKKWFLMPVVFFLILVGVLIVVSESSVVAPFIYAIF